MILSMIMLTMILTCIPPLLLTINNLLSKTTPSSREKKTPFECGFDPMSLSRIPMSIQFFLVGLVFLIFDVEITLLIPLVFMFKNFNLHMIMASMFFIMILIFGLYMEYSDQTIEWKI